MLADDNDNIYTWSQAISHYSMSCTWRDGLFTWSSEILKRTVVKWARNSDNFFKLLLPIGSSVDSSVLHTYRTETSLVRSFYSLVFIVTSTVWAIQMIW